MFSNEALREVTPDERYKNLHQGDAAFASLFSEYVNGHEMSLVDTGKALANDHRYLVQQKFHLFYHFVYELASLYERGLYDDRDEWACKTASLIKQLVFEAQ